MIDEARRRLYEVDRTPRPLVHDLIGTVVECLELDVEDFMDPSAGDGRFGEAVAAVSPRLRTSVAVEPRIEEVRNLRPIHSEVHSVGFLDYEPGEQRFDLIASNPPFRRAFGEPPTWLGRLHRLLKPRGVLALYAKTSLGQTHKMAAVFRQFEPILAIRVVGRVSHREHGRTDQHDVSMWAWGPGRPRPFGRRGWHTLQLEAEE
jgi:hypothetical protein